MSSRVSGRRVLTAAPHENNNYYPWQRAECVTLLPQDRLQRHSSTALPVLCPSGLESLTFKEIKRQTVQTSLRITGRLAVGAAWIALPEAFLTHA